MEFPTVAGRMVISQSMPHLSLLLGPFMYRRGGSFRGAIIAALAALMVGLLGWFLSR